MDTNAEINYRLAKWLICNVGYCRQCAVEVQQNLGRKEVLLRSV